MSYACVGTLDETYRNVLVNGPHGKGPGALFSRKNGQGIHGSKFQESWISEYATGTW